MKSFFITSCLVFSLFCSCTTAEDNQLSQKEKEDGWQLLFDGRSLSQWQNYGAETLNSKWQIKDGVFYIADSSGEAGDIVTKKQYENFEMKIDWKIAEKGNSGVFLRCDNTGKKAHSHALEIQMLDDENFRTAKGEKPEARHLSGSVYDLLAPKPGAFKGHSTWNTTHIIMKNTKVTVYMNGVLVSELDLNSEAYKKMFAESKFAKNKQTAARYAKNIKGTVGLQDHKSQMWFKNVKIREL